MADDIKEILGVLREQEKATASGDAASVVSPMAADIVTYDLPPPLEYRGAGEPAADGLRAWFATWRGPVKVELRDPTVMVDGNLAVVFGLSHMRGQKTDGANIDTWNRRTVVLRRNGGVDWRIVHEHSSYPLHMDGSGKAATNLKP
jgi:ketosteroid isomerase-like protein